MSRAQYGEIVVWFTDRFGCLIKIGTEVSWSYQRDEDKGT